MFTPEDGTGIADANAYIDVVFFKTYHKDRGNAVNGGTGDVEKAIIRATDFMVARWTAVGHQHSLTQGLHFPADQAYYYDGRIATGVPLEFQQSCADYALIELNSPGGLGPTPTVDPSGANVEYKREKVGPIEEETHFGQHGVKASFPKFPVPDRRLVRSGLVVGGRVERV